MIKLTNALGAEKILPLTMSFGRVPLEIDVPSQPLFGLDGNAVTGKPTLRPRQFVLEGSIYYPDKGRIEQELDALLPFLMHPPIEVYRHHRHDRFLRAWALGAPQDWLDGGAELALRIPMIAHDPYWYGPVVGVTISGTQTITVDGNAPSLPLIATTGSVSNLTVSNLTTGKQIVVLGANGKVTVDNVSHEIKVDTADKMGIVGDDWLIYGFELVPGDNVISTSSEVKLTYGPRWY